jgi:hypothetical protein
MLLEDKSRVTQAIRPISSVRRIALPEVVCLPLRDATVRSHIELACQKGETRPIVAQFRQIATRVK